MSDRIERYVLPLTCEFRSLAEEQVTLRSQPAVPITIASIATNAPSPGIFRIVSFRLSNVLMFEDVDAFDFRRGGGAIAKFEGCLVDQPITITPAHSVTATVRSTGVFPGLYEHGAFTFVLSVLGTMRAVDSITREKGESFGDYMKRLDRFTKGIP